MLCFRSISNSFKLNKFLLFIWQTKILLKKLFFFRIAHNNLSSFVNHFSLILYIILLFSNIILNNLKNLIIYIFNHLLFLIFVIKFDYFISKLIIHFSLFIFKQKMNPFFLIILYIFFIKIH